MRKVRNNEKESKMYDSERKESFLKEMIEGKSITEQTSKGYARIFKVTKKYEDALGKELLEFSLEEIETILYGFKANNRNTIETYGRVISGYFNWGVQENIISKNPLIDFKPDDFNKYLTNNESYISDIDLMHYEDRCNNYQDAVILRLLFIGVGGKKLSEIRNLKKEDVDFEHKRLVLTESIEEDANNMPVKFSKRVVDVDDRTLHLIQGAMNEKIYRKKNGEVELASNIRPYNDLVENDYVIRASVTKTDYKNCPIDIFVIYRRMANMSEFLGYDLTAKFVQRSGMIYLANKIISDETITLSDYKMVASSFNMKSYHNLKGFLTMENIRETYKE